MHRRLTVIALRLRPRWRKQGEPHPDRTAFAHEVLIGISLMPGRHGIRCCYGVARAVPAQEYVRGRNLSAALFAKSPSDLS